MSNTPERQNPVTRSNDTAAERSGGSRLSMHDGVEVSCDCCSCEAEPYWVEAMRAHELRDQPKRQ